MFQPEISKGYLFWIKLLQILRAEKEREGRQVFQQPYQREGRSKKTCAGTDTSSSHFSYALRTTTPHEYSKSPPSAQITTSKMKNSISLRKKDQAAQMPTA